MAVESFAMSGVAVGRWLISLIMIIIVGGSMATYDLGGFGDKSALAWCGIVDFALTGHMYNTTIAKNHKQCWITCKTQPHCISVNFASSNGQCDLNNATHYDYADDLKQGSGWVYTYSQIQTFGCSGQTPILSFANEQNKVGTDWPLGTYGLPMPIGGCPNDAGFTWETGYRYQDTQNKKPRNDWSDSPHFKGPYGENDMWQHFCMKTVDRVGNNDVNWPNGQYCVFKFGDNCPKGMKNGSIFWDDENNDNRNTVNGTVPSGVYDNDTLINYCCMTGGTTSDPITLPTSRPFYLFAYTAQCQEVYGMTVTREWFRLDNEKVNNQYTEDGSHPHTSNSYDHRKLHFCYYQNHAIMQSTWPFGAYGLPMPIGGCPTDTDFTWQTGYRYHGTGDINTNNDWSDSLHLKGPYGENDMWQHSCMKTVDRVGDNDANWPHGQYCVFKYGDNCPNGMSTGFIFWDDENNDNRNTVSGTVPSGVYDNDTLIKYCCMTGGAASNQITLPTSRPFYLFAYTYRCQKVKDMTVTLEWFWWKDEDDSSGDYQDESHPYVLPLHGHILHYCYYQNTAVETTWPFGAYSLPMPISGCPNDAGFTRETGYRYHVMENYNSSNDWFDSLHLKGPYGKNYMWQHFCMKTVDHVGDNDGNWPNGQYCVFKYGNNCPNGMSTRFIIWDDENDGNHSTVNGTLPSGVYDNDTLINYCCMTGGTTSDPITLPTIRPFYLFPYTAQCQEVYGMTATREWLHWNDDNIQDYENGSHPFDSGNEEEHKLHYCFYQKSVVEPGWPLGVYGLPMPISGCPDDADFTWQTGYRFHDTEDDNPSNDWSSSPHFKGPYGENDTWQHFCMNTVDRVGDNDANWPNGQYCVFKYGNNCPNGMESGSIFWDDENNNNHNTVNGTVPSGVYDNDTLINYCCMSNGVQYDPIILPTSRPFYLFAYTDQCQEVYGMTVRREWFRWDNEDDNNQDDKEGNQPRASSHDGHKVHYCYYKSVGA